MYKMKYTTHVVCKHCSKSYMHPDCVGKTEESDITRSISRHLIKCTLYNIKKNKAKIFDFASRMKKSQTILDDYDNDSIIDKILKLFISRNIIFKQVDNSYFQDLIHHIEVKVSSLKINRKFVHI